MSTSLRRRLERLAQRCGEVAGRLIVVEMHEARWHDGALLDATIADAGISRTDQDLVVKLKRYAPDPAEPPCALRSATTLEPLRPNSPW